MPVSLNYVSGISKDCRNTLPGIEREQGNKSEITGIVQHGVPFKSKALRCLSQIPLLKALPVVTAYVTDTRINNQLLLTQFILSLSETVSEDKLVAATEALQIKAGKPLTDRDFQIMTNRIVNFDGIGDAQRMPRRVQVNIWPYESISRPGHVSMTVQHDNNDNPETHISWGPDTERSGSLYDRYFASDKPLKSDSYDSDAVDAISERSMEKLQAFDELRKIQKEGSLNKTLLSAINDQTKKIYQVARKNFDVQMKNNAIFSSMQPVAQKALLTQRVTKEIIRRNDNFAEPGGIIESHQQALTTKISPGIVNIMFDEALTLSEGMNLAAIFTKRAPPGFLEQLNEKILTDTEIQMNRDATVQSILKDTPYFMPRARQTKDKYQNWMVNAEKVFLPLKGSQGAEAFALFGLDEQAIQRHWAGVQLRAENNEIGYRFISKDKNCSGIVAGILLAGGAGDFVAFKTSLFAETPNDVHHYALAVQRRIDSLNHQSADIKAFYQREQQNPELGHINGQPASDASIPMLRDNISQAINIMSSEEKKRFSALKEAVHHIPEDSTDEKELTKAGIGLVEALRHLLNNSLPFPQTGAVFRVLFGAAALRESLEKMLKNSISSGRE